MEAKRIAKTLAETSLVSSLPDRMRARFVGLVLELAQASDARSGDVLFTRGEKNTDEGLFVLEGAVKVTRANGEVRYLEAPDVLGEVQLFAPSAERTATVEVVYGGTVLRFSWKELAAASKKAFSPAEMGVLRDAIRDNADARERHLLINLMASRRPVGEGKELQ
jgi:hypothetical protein